MGLIALVMVALAENGRIPIDNPATHLELTMVHEAMVLEYSGRHLALIELAAMLKLRALCLADRLRVRALDARHRRREHRRPAAGRRALSRQARDRRRSRSALFETSIAKMRVFRVPDFLGAALMLGFLGALLLFVSRSLK